MAVEKILEVKNLSVVLDGEDILKNISFEVGRGEALSIIGPNGAGKSVLFRALLGLLPYRGEISWRDEVKIGYIPQRFAVDRSIPITVREFILLKSPRFWFCTKEFMEHVDHELDLVGLPKDILAKRLGELSGGQLQRLLVSWAMLNHPEVLLFDEPTAGIDVGVEETIYNLIRRLQKERGTTILLISHDLNVVYKYAENVLCLNREMLCHGRPREVLNPQELATVYGEGSFFQHPARH